VPNRSSENFDLNDAEEKVFEGEMKADDALKNVASIMKVLCSKNPMNGNEFFNNMKEDNPDLMYYIKKNEAQFKSLLYSPVTEEDKKIFKKLYRGTLNNNNNTDSNANVGTTTTTTTSTANKAPVDTPPINEDVKNLTAYGFSLREANEAYEVCGKNFELALNYLLDGNTQK